MKQKPLSILLTLGVALLTLFGCNDYHHIPPNDIGMMLTPTGYEEKIYTPGMINLGMEGTDGQMNRLVLIQRSGVEIKEAFTGKEASEDHEDHRCLLGDKSPMTFDVRLLLALPNYETPEGAKDLARLFLLGNPEGVKDTNERVLRISTESVYAEQARQPVRGRIRQICAGYANFDAAFAALVEEGDKGLARQVERAIAEVLEAKKVPLKLVSAFPSNMKPDPSVIDAISAEQAAERRVKAIQKVTNFLDADKTGSRRLVYQMQTWQEIVASGNANGHNTILFNSGASDATMVIPMRSPPSQPKPAETKEPAPAKETKEAQGG